MTNTFCEVNMNRSKLESKFRKYATLENKSKYRKRNFIVNVIKESKENIFQNRN